MRRANGQGARRFLLLPSARKIAIEIRLPEQRDIDENKPELQGHSSKSAPRCYSSALAIHGE